jgi:hypothetical protein
MIRGLGTAALAAVQAEIVACTRAVELLFAGGPVRLNGSTETIVIGGNDYLGVGLLGGITTIAEEADLRNAGISLTLAGVPRDAVSLAFNEQYQGRQATVFEVFLDAAGAVIEAIVVFRGRMDQMNIRYGEICTVEVTLEDRLTDMDRPNLRRYTDADQQREYPGDRGFEFVPATVEKEIIWPARSFTQ